MGRRTGHSLERESGRTQEHQVIRVTVAVRQARCHRVKIPRSRSPFAESQQSFLEIDRDSYRIFKARETAGNAILNYESGIVAAMQFLHTHIDSGLLHNT
jgi:hypothetical protein